MANSKLNPKRWYFVMYLCLIVSFLVFSAGPRIGYNAEDAHMLAMMIGVWAPTLGVFGLRAELLQKKD